MSNPFFSRSAAFKAGSPAPGTAPAQTPNGYPTMPGYQAGQYGQQAAGYGQQYGQYANQYGQQAAGYGQVSPEQMAGLEAQYQAPSATNADMRRMTYDDVIIRTAGMFAVILATGALCWNLVTNEATFALGAMAVFAGAVGSFILGLVIMGRAGAFLTALGTPEAAEMGMVLSNAVPCLIIGLLFMACSAIWDEPVMAWVGGWFLAVTTAATLVGGTDLWAIMALAGGGGALVAAAVDVLRTRAARRAAR